MQQIPADGSGRRRPCPGAGSGIPAVRRGFGLDIDQPVFGQDARQERPQARQPALSERRIEQDQVNRDASIRSVTCIASPTWMRIMSALSLSRSVRSADAVLSRSTICMRHAARGRLEARRAAAGEQVQHLLVGELAAPQVIEPVEQRLAHPVGRGAQRLHVGHGNGVRRYWPQRYEYTCYPCSAASRKTLRPPRRSSRAAAGGRGRRSGARDPRRAGPDGRRARHSSTRFHAA